MIKRDVSFHARLLCGAAVVALAAGGVAKAQDRAHIHIEPQLLVSALNEFGVKTGQPVISTPELTASKLSPGVKDADDPAVALAQLLSGTGLSYRCSGDTYLIVPSPESGPAPKRCVAAGAGGSDGADNGTVQALIVTAQKREEDIQDVPIAISAFTQEDLTRSQVAGGPDLMTQVPNFTFTKTNFSGYSIQIRGIGTQAISATTDPAVAVAFNNTPFIRNRFFEQEFYDLERVEVLRGPQGTLYGRNATAGVVNILSAKPSFQYEAKLSGDVANYKSTRLEGMVNIPLVEDKVALRLAGAWTKRNGFVTNEITGNPIDGRDLWSTRLSLRFEPTENIKANLIWEHFQENDDRLRSGKQLCKKDLKSEIGGIALPDVGGAAGNPQNVYSQGCTPVSMYSDEAFQTPNGYALPYYGPLTQLSFAGHAGFDPYRSTTQSRDLRVIESTIDPKYRAKSDLGEFQVGVNITPALTLTSETAYSTDTLFSFEDYNRFDTAPGAFQTNATAIAGPGTLDENGVFCDPQLGCADRLVVADVSSAASRQFSQEFRLSSDFEGPFNFNLGANFLRYDTEDKYYVFFNSLTLYMVQGGQAQVGSAEGHFGNENRALWPAYVPGVWDNSRCSPSRRQPNPAVVHGMGCEYIDPNPIGSLNDEGHNYFLSRNPYRLISYAAFGEAYYNITPALKLTGGLRWTVDKKRAPLIPSWLLVEYGGSPYPVLDVVDQEWREPTGRVAIDWKPDLSFTDETLIYASYAHGYKAGGANPPPAVIATLSGQNGVGDAAGLLDSIAQPKTFNPEFVNAFEVGTKNTLLDGRLTLNLGAFYYDYTGYQISEILNRSAVNMNFDARVWGAEIEADWRPLENLRLGFKGGYENTRVADGMRAIDLMDRTAGDPNYVVARPFPTIPSNCIIPVWFATFGGEVRTPNEQNGQEGMCSLAYNQHLDPVTKLPYVPNPTEDNGGTTGLAQYPDYPGFDYRTVPNNGEGIFKDLSGKELPNAPHFTATVTADYTLPLPHDWLMTLHADYYHQSAAWTRIFNDNPYDRLKPYTNVNLAAIFANEDAGWQVMAYVKNIFDTDAITGAFLNSDDTGLTTNVFLLEPRLYGLRVTKKWTGTPLWGTGGHHAPGEPYALRVEIGASVDRIDAPNQVFKPDFVDSFTSPGLPFPLGPQTDGLDWGDGRDVKITYAPTAGSWKASIAYRRDETNGSTHVQRQEQTPGSCLLANPCPDGTYQYGQYNYADTKFGAREEHTQADFMVGKDFGLGSEQSSMSSSLSLGLRYARLTSSTSLGLGGIPDYYRAPEKWNKYPRTNHRYESSLEADRSFAGAGPVLSWDGSKALLGNDEIGRVEADWAVDGGVLFGKQKATIDTHVKSSYYYNALPFFGSAFETHDTVDHTYRRNGSITVPTLGLSAGLSYEVERVKVSGGYRWDRYFNVIDGGIETRKKEDRTIDGPYVKISVGFGG